MPIKYLPSDYAFFTEGPSLTEPEHADSCDINKMVLNAARGMEIRGSSKTPTYGYDDTTLDGVQFRIQKQQLEESLQTLGPQAELTPELISKLDLKPDFLQKFGFKTKKTTVPKQNEQTQTNEQNTGLIQNTPEPDSSTIAKKS